MHSIESPVLTLLVDTVTKIANIPANSSSKTLGFTKFFFEFRASRSRVSFVLFRFVKNFKSQYLGLAKKTLALPFGKVSHSSKQQTARENYRTINSFTYRTSGTEQKSRFRAEKT